MATKDWVEWHRAYDDPDSGLSWRLRRIQQRITESLDQMPAGQVRVASLCAGDGRDLLGVLSNHSRSADVVALLVEQDSELSSRARQQARSLAAQVRVVTGDAAKTDHYAELVPVDLVLLCGIFGNVADEDVANCVRQLPGFCKPGALVVWTRYRRPPDLVPRICQWFREAGFAEEFVEDRPGSGQCVGGHRYLGPEIDLRRGVQLFRFL